MSEKITKYQKQSTVLTKCSVDYFLKILRSKRYISKSQYDFLSLFLFFCFIWGGGGGGGGGILSQIG